MIEILAARGLSRSFGSVRAVRDVSFEVHSGEVVGLLGPNGAGKTTMLRMIAGVVSPDAGQILLNGVDISSDPIAAKRQIGFLSGDTQLYQRLSPRECLEYFGRLYGMEQARLKRRVDELISRLRMESFAERRCSTLSSGQKQRANIARAFLHEPGLLILDEPTSALDVVSGHFIVESIREEKHAGRAVIFSTHIMSEAEYLCDRIVLLHEGKVVDQGSLPELLERSGCANLTDTFLKQARIESSQESAA
jgi:sodium transport system ATP-binding protein